MHIKHDVSTSFPSEYVTMGTIIFTLLILASCYYIDTKCTRFFPAMLKPRKAADNKPQASPEAAEWKLSFKKKTIKCAYYGICKFSFEWNLFFSVKISSLLFRGSFFFPPYDKLQK